MEVALSKPAFDAWEVAVISWKRLLFTLMLSGLYFHMLQDIEWWRRWLAYFLAYGVALAVHDERKLTSS